MLNYHQPDSRDVELESTISQTIHSLASGIHVSAKGGHVILSGMVDDFATKRDITSVVQNLAGVKTLSNCMRVTPIGD